MTATLQQIRSGDLGATKSQSRRHYGYVPNTYADLPQDGTLAILAGRLTTHYGVSLTDARFGGLTFVLEKIGEEPEHYECFVATDGRSKSTCTCWGNRRHGHCKHVDALADLVRTEEIPHPSAAPEADAVSAAVDAV